MNKQTALPTMKEPAIYRIRVRGHLDAKWSERLEGMNITEVRHSEKDDETILVGRLADQAALAGVMNTLYEQHLPVLSVDCLEEG
jgi:hypothetical protein